jgi:hypothetical protein
LEKLKKSFENKTFLYLPDRLRLPPSFRQGGHNLLQLYFAHFSTAHKKAEELTSAFDV